MTTNHITSSLSFRAGADFAKGFFSTILQGAAHVAVWALILLLALAMIKDQVARVHVDGLRTCLSDVDACRKAVNIYDASRKGKP